MDEAGFWGLVDHTVAQAGGDVNEQTQLLARRLREMSPEEVLAFDDHVTAASHALYRWPVWEAADVMIGDASDDIFADFRAWVVSRGSEVHRAVLADPDAGLAAVPMTDLEDVGKGEGFAAAAGSVYEELTGTSIFDAFPDRPSADFPGHDPAGERTPGSRADRAARYPLVAAAHPDGPVAGLPWPLRLLGGIRFPWRD